MGGGTSRCAAGVFPCLPLIVKQWHANGRRPSPWATCARARLSSPSARSSTASGARRSLGADACTSRPSPQGEACAVAMASRAHRASSPPGARPHAPRRRQPHALPAVTRGQSRPDAAVPAGARPCSRRGCPTASGSATTSSPSPRACRPEAVAVKKRPASPRLVMQTNATRGAPRRGHRDGAVPQRARPCGCVATQRRSRRGARSQTRGRGAARHPRARPAAHVQARQSAG
jgi:hypothetical protein